MLRYDSLLYPSSYVFFVLMLSIHGQELIIFYSILSAWNIDIEGTGKNDKRQIWYPIDDPFEWIKGE